MSRIYTEADYHGIVDDNYRRYTFYNDQLDQLGSRFTGQIRNQKFLIAGCGWGFTVEMLMRDRGFGDVWGCDASEYAVQVAAPRELEPQYAARIVLADVTVRQNMNSLRSTAGLGGNQRFRVTVTEDLLPTAASVAEAQTMLSELRRVSTDIVHIVTPDEHGFNQMPGFLWLSPESWRDLIGSGEPIFLTGTYEEVP